ncbi:MAG: hypothetical protein IH988_07600 [Planctomycetes bacterium]|nr:hypothetical protein [Planctomycetota bacterium]
MSDPAFDDEPFADDSPPPEGVGEGELDQLLADVSHKTKALLEEVAGDSAGTSRGRNAPDSDAPAPADSNADVDVRMADVEALVAAAKIDVGPEIEDAATPVEQSAVPLSASESPGIASADWPAPPYRPADHDAGSPSMVPSEYRAGQSETGFGDSKMDAPDRLENDDETDSGPPTGRSAWGQARLNTLLNLLDMLDRRMGWLGSGARRILGFVAVATLVTAIALWIVSLVVEAELST